MRACKQQWHGRKQTWNFLLRQVLHNPQCDSNGTLAVVLFCGKTHKMSSYQSLKHPSGIFSNCSCLCERIYLEIVRKVKPSGEPGPVGRHKVKQSQSNTKVSSNCWLFFFLPQTSPKWKQTNLCPALSSQVSLLMRNFSIRLRISRLCAENRKKKKHIRLSMN